MSKTKQKHNVEKGVTHDTTHLVLPKLLFCRQNKALFNVLFVLPQSKTSLYCSSVVNQLLKSTDYRGSQELAEEAFEAKEVSEHHSFQFLLWPSCSQG